MGSMRTLRLDFADINDTVLYLGDACPITVTKNVNTSFKMKGKGEISNYALDISLNGVLLAWLKYDDEAKRDTDYEYVLEQLDEYMGVNDN